MNNIKIDKIDTNDYSTANRLMLEAIKSFGLKTELSRRIPTKGKMYISGLGYVKFELGQERLHVYIAGGNSIHVLTDYKGFLAALINLGKTINNNN